MNIKSSPQPNAYKPPLQDLPSQFLAYQDQAYQFSRQIHHGIRSRGASLNKASRAIQLSTLRIQELISIPRRACSLPKLHTPNLPHPPLNPAHPPFLQAAVEDLQPPAALSLTPSDPISAALDLAFERDYTHLTIIDNTTRALLGYISIPTLQALLDNGKAQPADPLSAAMTRFQRKGRAYKVITMDTPLEELEAFFEGAATGGQRQDFAVVTDVGRRFVLGVATREDLEEFVKRRPA